MKFEYTKIRRVKQEHTPDICFKGGVIMVSDYGVRTLDELWRLVSGCDAFELGRRTRATLPAMALEFASLRASFNFN